MMQQVIAVLMQIVNDQGGLQLLEIAHMSIQDCLDLAYKVNSGTDPVIVMCAPDLSSPVVTH